jgi:hypothetical protein
MSVDDYGIEVLKKAAVELVANDKSEYKLRVFSEPGDSNPPSGLQTAGRITTMNVSASAIALPTTALTDRNALSIRNLDSTTTLYVGFHTGVTATDTVGTDSGWQVGPDENIQFDITDDIVIYGIVASGTIKVQVMELS